ncbi:MAG: F0F1 ATP synthase subunit A [Candidatus Omnitrophica bacterium]|nr:F0F1 ATP synthase subunit A [Candidatus Omnitrophota bacterium]
MSESAHHQPELPNIITLLAEAYKDNHFFAVLYEWQNLIYSLLVVAILTAFAYFATRRPKNLPGKLQNFAELIVGGLDEFVCGILGPHGREYVPFIGTLFLYIISINILGLIPFLKSSTASWSTTLGLALCVFFYVQFSAIRKMGFFGYIDHLAGKPRGVMAFTIVLPLFTFCLHLIAEFVKPVSLSLRLRSNIWGDELLLAVLTTFGMKGLPLLILNTMMALLAAIVQAVVFSLLTTIYFALVLSEEH